MDPPTGSPVIVSPWSERSPSDPASPDCDDLNVGGSLLPLDSSYDDKPYPHCPVYIPTRGRSDLERGTLCTLVRDLIPFVVVVEPGEEGAYHQLLDHLVFQLFGGSGMVHPAASEGIPTEIGNDGGGSPQQSGFVTNEDTDSIKPRFPSGHPPCACCCLSPAADDAHHSSYAKKVSAVYHHGYVYVPPTVGRPSMGEAGRVGGLPTSTTRSNGDRIASSTFTLHSVEDIRALFQVAVLPQGNRGISYVRNYILHVLVPQMMVGSGLDRDGHIEGLGLFAKGENRVLSEMDLENGCGLDPAYIQEHVVQTALARKEERLPVHGLYGYYWVMDDDIFSFSQGIEAEKRNQRISARQMMREVEGRIRTLLRTAMADPAAATAMQTANRSSSTFTCKEDAVQNNLLPLLRQPGGSATTVTNTANYMHIAQTACFSLEYGRFAFTYDDTALAINSYNNIACLFSYNLLHNPMKPNFFPAHATHGLNSPQEVLPSLSRGIPDNMMWYRFAVREDYDFTLQLIARGMYTLRFRNLSFEVPQMSKVKGGMTEYYKNCTDDIKEQNTLFVRQWPSIALPWVKGKNTTERHDIRVRWDLLHPARARYPGAFLFLRDPLPQLTPQQPRPASQTSAVSSYAGAPQAEPLIISRPPSFRPQAKVIIAAPPQRQTKVLLNVKTTVGSTTPPTPTAAKRPRSSSSSSSGAVDSTVGRTEVATPEEEVDVSPDTQPVSADPLAVAEKGGSWRGYAVERWRDISQQEAIRLGLVPLDAHSLRPGQTVLVVPPLFSQNPSVVAGTLLEKTVTGSSHIHHHPSEGEPDDVSWTVVAQKVRGIPILSVKQCYAVPENGDTGPLIAAVDRFFSKLRPALEQTASPTNQGHNALTWLDD